MLWLPVPFFLGVVPRLGGGHVTLLPFSMASSCKPGKDRLWTIDSFALSGHRMLPVGVLLRGWPWIGMGAAATPLSGMVEACFSLEAGRDGVLPKGILPASACSGEEDCLRRLCKASKRFAAELPGLLVALELPGLLPALELPGRLRFCCCCFSMADKAAAKPSPRTLTSAADSSAGGICKIAPAPKPLDLLRPSDGESRRTSDGEAVACKLPVLQLVIVSAASAGHGPQSRSMADGLVSTSSFSYLSFLNRPGPHVLVNPLPVSLCGDSSLSTMAPPDMLQVAAEINCRFGSGTPSTEATWPSERDVREAVEDSKSGGCAKSRSAFPLSSGHVCEPTTWSMFLGVLVDSEPSSVTAVAQLPCRLRTFTEPWGLAMTGNIAKPQRGHFVIPSISSSMLSKWRLGIMPIRSVRAWEIARGSEAVPDLALIKAAAAEASPKDPNWPLLTFSS
mmetsp:Transcript_8130/g.18133  ORF Transcript_8130/g.18133 Transcript_8130/m.18133 type:complete len:450 (-) Transcript_8130:2505-3854(-)